MTKRVLVTGGANIGKAGVATIIYKWGQEFDSNVLVYDYLMQSGLPDSIYQQAITNKGGIMFTCGNDAQRKHLIRWISDVIRKEHYKTIHINSDSAYIAAAYIFAAKRAGIKKIFVHSHCTQIDETNSIKRALKIIMHKICRSYVCANTEMFLACSVLAGEWMFGMKNVKSDRYKTIYNGVEVEKYLYDSSARNKIRSEFGLQDQYVIANIGRLSYQKNQEFLIRMFSRYYKQNNNSKLLIIGVGELNDELHELARQLKVQDAIIFTGNRNDVPQILSAADVLVMPSRFEGLPVTMVEAQMADLPCVVSSTITKEAQYTTNVVYVEGWNESPWIEAIEDMRKVSRTCNSEEKYNSVFNIQNAARELQTILAR